MIIRKASPSDKRHVLEFCKSTFSWGDYIAEIWDFWINEDDLFVLDIDGNPIGICHVVYNDPAWIEGIRIHPNFRKMGFGSALIKSAEASSLKNNISDICMLIETHNLASISLAQKECYDIYQNWTFYTLTPHEIPSASCKIAKSISEISDFIPKIEFYVDSWRWIRISDKSLKSLIENKNVFYSKNSKEDLSIGFLIDSKHFTKTKILTISGQGKSLEDLLRYVQHVCYKENIHRLQILTPALLPTINGIEKKTIFHLMKKSISRQP